MWQYRHFACSFLMHAIVIAILYFTADSILTAYAPKIASMEEQNKPVINASLIDSKAVDAEIKKIELEEKHKQDVLIRERNKITQAKKALEKKEQEAKLLAQKAQEEAKQASLLKKKLAEEQENVKKEKEKVAKLQQNAEEAQKLALKEKQEAVEAANKLKQDMVKFENEKVATKTPPQAPVVQASKNIIDSEISKFKKIIGQQIKQNWVAPSGMPSDLTCDLEIKLFADGSLADISVAKSSGNEAFDQLAIRTIYKSSPFQMPKNKDVMEKFRHFIFTYNPKTIG